MEELFRLRPDTKARVLAQLLAFPVTKNSAGGYAFTAAELLRQNINRILCEQVYEFSNDGMTGLGDRTGNTLNSYKSNIMVTKQQVLKEAKAAAKAASTKTETVEPEFTTNSDAQDEANLRNSYRLAAIGVKEGVAEAITALVGEAITNPVLRSADGLTFKTVDEYQLHELLTAIKEGAERPEATTIRANVVTFVATNFDFRESIAINMERLATAATKVGNSGVKMDNDLKAIILLANVEWAARQSWGNELSVAHREIKKVYKYNHAHTDASIKEMAKLLSPADEARDKTLATQQEGDTANMVGERMSHLQRLVDERGYGTDTSGESAYAASEATKDSRGRSTSRRNEGSRSTQRDYSPASYSYSRDRSYSPRGRSHSRHRSNRDRDRDRDRNRDNDRRDRDRDRRSRSPERSRTPEGGRGGERKAYSGPTNPTKCPHCKKYGRHGGAHTEGYGKKSHAECFFNKDFKGERPEYAKRIMEKVDARK